MIIGYKSFTTKKEKSLQKFEAFGCHKVFFGKQYSKNKVDFDLQTAFSYLKPNDIFVVESLLDLGKSTNAILLNLGILTEKKVNLQLLTPFILISLQSSTALLENLLIAQSKINQSQAEIRAKTRQKKGSRIGRPTIVDSATKELVATLRQNENYDIKTICNIAGISEGTFYNHFVRGK